MWLAEVVPPVGPVFVPALAALFTLAALFFAIGMVKLVDKVSRAFFGTVGGAVGWIPFAGKIVKHSLHKIEQKISHILGSAERTLDGYVALTWHNMARLVTLMGKEIEGAAVSAWHLAQQAQAFVRQKDVSHAVRSGVAPVRSQVANVGKAQAADHAHTKALSHSVAQGVYPRLKSAEWEIDHVLEPGLEAVRARTKALEHGAIRTFDWINAHRRGVAAGVFTAAVAWALSKLGGGWIRCANWRRIGKTVCGLPRSRIDALLGLLLGALALANIRTLARFAEAVEHDAARAVADLVGVATRADGQFTIE